MTEFRRHTDILELLNKEQYLSVDSIVQAFNVSPATVRRDIKKLSESGKLRKIRNGVEVLIQEKKHWCPLNRSQAKQDDVKYQMAKIATNLVQPGEDVIINCGSTAFMIGQAICGQNIQIITNYFPLVKYLIEHNHEHLVIIGGQYNSQQSVILAPQDDISSLYAGHWMFTSGKGLTTEGLYKMDVLTATAEQKMLEHSDKLVVLADSSKIGKRSGMLFCESSRIDVLITEKDADPKILEHFREKNVRLLLV